MKRAHDHLITIDQEAGCIRVFRVMPDGEHLPYTMVALPDKGLDKKRLQALAQILGEDILVDSALAQSLYG